jgi:hypothetical protein
MTGEAMAALYAAYEPWNRGLYDLLGRDFAWPVRPGLKHLTLPVTCMTYNRTGMAWVDLNTKGQAAGIELQSQGVTSG